METLIRAAAAHPVAGNLWHADHINPVFNGGGEATIENIQTLCVACHRRKTIAEQKYIQEARRNRLVQPGIPSVIPTQQNQSNGGVNSFVKIQPQSTRRRN